jgi:hypothetical protein
MGAVGRSMPPRQGRTEQLRIKLVKTEDPANLFLLVRHGAGGRTRTDDLPLTRRLLYQLSYTGAHR